MEKADVIIIGAGIAGLTAAVASIQKGLKTILVEKNDYTGGIAKDCFHTYICGLFQNDVSNPFTLANKGLCLKVFNALHDCYGDSCLVRLGRVETLAFKQTDLWNFFNKNLNQSNNKNLFLFLKNHECIDTSIDNNKICEIKLSNKNNNLKLEAGVFIDASGCSFFKNKQTNPEDLQESTQLGGFCYLLEGPFDKKLPLLVPYSARSIVKKHNLDDYLKYVTITYNFLTKQHVLKFSVEKSEDIEKCDFLYEKLKTNIKQLSNLNFVKSSHTIHLRSCSKVSVTDFDSDDKNSSDCIKSYWPAERWDRDKGPEYKYIQKNIPFTIPDRALRDNKYNNLFLAGKSIRVSENTHSSARVMGICMATGEKALFNACNYLHKM